MEEDRKTASDTQTNYEAAKPEEFSWKDGYDELLKAIKSNTPVVLFGPPGTGKTRMVYDVKKSLEDDKTLGKFEAVQFHKKFTYEDFIEGFAPDGSGSFAKKDGVFKSFIKDIGDKQSNIFFIDEMNRAELTTTFGELLFLIEDRGVRKVRTSHFNEELVVPENLVIVGTMNTADRNIAILDYALRRRFTFIPVFPDYDVLKEILNSRGFDVSEITLEQYVKMTQLVNRRISKNRLMGRNMQLGQSMWVPSGNGEIKIGDIVRLFEFSILPQLEAYCGFGYEDELKSLLSPNVANVYLQSKKLSNADVFGLVRDLNNKQE